MARNIIINLDGETLNLESAAAFMKMTPETLRQEAAAGRAPGVKMGRRWVFIKVDLIDHMRNLYGKKAIKDKITGKKIWLSTNRENIGELELLPQMEKEYNAALGRQTEKRLSSLKQK